jgi:hypothetical protein
MSRARSTHERDEKFCKILTGEMGRRDRLENRNVDEKIALTLSKSRGYHT